MAALDARVVDDDVELPVLRLDRGDAFFTASWSVTSKTPMSVLALRAHGSAASSAAASSIENDLVAPDCASPTAMPWLPARGAGDAAGSCR
jgi:hypothetical protein